MDRAATARSHRFSLLRIIRCPLIPFDAIFSKVKCADTTNAMNGGHGPRNGTTFCLLTKPASGCNITIVEFEFGDIVVRGC
ncbi:UNVERIFIED_CONTAM: hypothetical protein NCL1_36727 [Trichonephila clavipes]